MKEQIAKIEELKKELSALPQSSHLGNAICALSAAKDNLLWHTEAAAKKEASAKRSEKPQTSNIKPQT
jgi:hypothetical protein